MKRALLIVVIASLLVPIVVPVLEVHSTFHIGHAQVWFRRGYEDWAPLGWSVGIQTAGGSRYPLIIVLPGWLAIVWCAALPVFLTIYVQRKSKKREPQWVGALWTLFAAWLL